MSCQKALSAGAFLRISVVRFPSLLLLGFSKRLGKPRVVALMANSFNGSTIRMLL